MEKLLVLFGTRPEAIKLFPVVTALKKHSAVQTICCVTAQHREMLDQVLAIAGIVPDYDLDLMTAGQTLDALTARLLTGLGTVMDEVKPDCVIVQGDTATAMSGALAAYYRQIPVAHVEAGLRSGDIYHPWPEEVNRKIIGQIARWHFAPTETAGNALKAENIAADSVFVTGNTVIDALNLTRDRIAEDPAMATALAPVLERFAGKRIIGVTTHRRENFGSGLENIASALQRIAALPDVAIIFPIHPNPNVRAIMDDALAGIDTIAMIDPLDYPNFVALQMACELMLTDSGGVQEEAPALGKPVLVMRETTERPEGVEAGTARLVGTDADRIYDETVRLLTDPAAYDAMAQAHNPFGDGHSSDRIAKLLLAD